VTPYAFKSFASIGFNDDKQTSTRQTLGAKSIVQLIGYRARGKRGNVNAFGRRIDDRLSIERPRRRPNRGRSIVNPPSESVKKSTFNTKPSNNIIDIERSKVPESA
jgi:hypothetical protein